MKKLFLIGLIFLLCVSSGLGVVDDYVYYFSFNDSEISGIYLNSTVGDLNLSVQGTVDNTVDGLVAGGVDGLGTGGYQTDSFTSSFPYNTDSYSISLWFNASSMTNFERMVRVINKGNFGIRTLTGNKIQFSRFSPSDDIQIGSTDTVTTNSWNHVFVTYNNATNTGTLYLNNVTQGTDTCSVSDCPYDYGGSTFDFFQYPTPEGRFDGVLDEFVMYSRVLSDEERYEVYYQGLNNLGINETESPGIINFSLTATDLNGVTINNFSAIINGTGYTTTTGTINTEIEQDSGLVDITLENATDSNGAFFNTSASNVDTASNYEFSNLYQVQADFQGYEIVSNNSIDGEFYLDNGSLAPLVFMADSYNITFVNDSYYNLTEELSFSALQNETVPLLGVYSSLINVTVTNAYSGENLSNFTGFIYSYNETYNETFNTTTGFVELPAIYGSYLLYAEVDGYAVSEETNYLNKTVSNVLENATFGLYSSNSVYFNVYDSETNVYITSNVSITLTGADENTYYTSTGKYFLSNITDGNYTVKVVDVAGNYSLSSYYITVADNSYQTLNTYLTADAEQVVFTVTDSLTSASLEGATFSQSKLINATYTLIESKSTDITGKAQFNYISTAKYRFIISLTGYTSKTFYLDPILFSTYTVSLDPEISSDIEPQYSHVEIEFYPVNFTNNANNTLNVLFSSFSGALNTYYLNMTYKNKSAYFSGSNAYGSDDTLYLLIENATITDTVNISYGYDTVLGKAYDFKATYYIINSSSGNQTINDNRIDDYGLGWFERVTIALFVVLLVSGLVGFVSGYAPALGVGLLLSGYFTFINFIPLWGLILSGFVGIIILTSRPGGGI